MNLRHVFSQRQQFRLVLCGHKAVEVGAVCLVLMVQGNLGEVTLAHFLIATKTGLWAISPALGITFTRYARHLVNFDRASPCRSSPSEGKRTTDSTVALQGYPADDDEDVLLYRSWRSSACCIAT